MGRKSKPPEAAPGAPLWMVTFTDCMNLLLTFFIILVTFSSFDGKTLGSFRRAFRKQAFGVFPPEPDQSAFLPISQIWATAELEKGSETPTLVPEAVGKDASMKEDKTDFHNPKVFAFPSQKIFLGQGERVSPQGRKLIGTVAAFLKTIPGQIIISEGGGQNGSRNSTLGISRAWSVVEYLTTVEKFDKNRLTISTESIAVEGPSRESNEQFGRNERTLDIVLLERSIWN